MQVARRGRGVGRVGKTYNINGNGAITSVPAEGVDLLWVGGDGNLDRISFRKFLPNQLLKRRDDASDQCVVRRCGVACSEVQDRVAQVETGVARNDVKRS